MKGVAHRSGLLALALLAVGASPVVPTDDTPTILVTRQLSKALGLAQGDVIHLSSGPSGRNARPFRVVGIYEPAANPMRFTSERLETRLHLPDLLALTADGTDPSSRDAVSAINIALVDPADAAAFARDLAAGMPGLVVRPAAPQKDEDNPFIVLQRFHLAIAIVTVVASTIFLLALMVMLVDERRQTIGILRLIGLRKRRVLLQVFVEGLLIALAGALVGISFAVASQQAFNRFFQWRYDTSLVFVHVTPGIAGRCLVLALPLGMVASLVSCWGLLRRDIFTLARR